MATIKNNSVLLLYVDPPASANIMNNWPYIMPVRS